MPISFGLTSNLSIDQNLSVGGTAAITSTLTLSSTTASSLLYSNASKVVSSVTLASNLSLTTGTLALATALTSINSVTAESGTALTLTGGSSGASLALGSGSNIATLNRQMAFTSGTLNLANLVLQSVATNVTDKSSDIVATPYTSANTAFASLRTFANATDNFVTLGGGSGAYNAATSILFYTGATNNTLTGTEAARITPTRTLLIGTTTQPASLTGGVSIVASGSGATATGVQTGGLQSANFGLSTVSGGASYFGGAVTANGGGTTATLPFSSANTTLGGFEIYSGSATANQRIWQWQAGTAIGDGTIRLRAVNDALSNGSNAISITRTGDAVGTISFGTTTAVVSVLGTTSASSSTVGALTIGNGTAATNVAIGGGRINAGADITATAGTFSGLLQTSSGGFVSYGSLGLGTAYTSIGGGFQTSYDTPNTRIFYGDGSGYFLRLSTRAASATTDRFTFSDTGNLVITGTSPSTSSTTGALQVAGGIYAGAASVFSGISNPGSGTGSERLGASANTSTSQYATAVGNSAAASGTYGSAFGYNAQAVANATAIGVSANASGQYATAIGYSAAATAFNSVAIGSFSTATNQAIAIGYTHTAATGDVIIGIGNTAAEVYLGQGKIAAADYGTRIQPASGSGAGVAGGTLRIAGGKGGDATTAGGSLIFQTAAAGTGTTLTDRFTIAPSGAATFAGAVTHTLGTNYPPQTAPASPASGWVLYTDSGDGNKLKAKASTGTVVTLGTP